MKAVVFNQYGGVDQLLIKDLPVPVVQEGEVLIRVKAFGINRAEIQMRKGLWGDVACVSGIECVGEVAMDKTGRYARGQKVAAIMGGMGRSRNGSYAEYTCVPAANVFSVKTSLDWGDFAAIPESYATAWSCLHDNLKINEGDVIFIRGGTSALGLAAIKLASVMFSARVLASTRNPDNVSLLKDAGCSKVLIESAELSEQIRSKYTEGIDGVMDIIGNSTLLDSLKMVKKAGYVCNAGFLGGSEPVVFNPLMDMPSSVNLNFFASFMLGTADYSIDKIPMQDIVFNAEQGKYKVKPVKKFAFNDIAQAHDLMESNKACGKVVVVL